MCPRTKLYIGPASLLKRSFEPPASLRQVSMSGPESPHRHRQPERRRGVSFQQQAQRRAQIVVLLLHPVEPLRLMDAQQLWLGLFREREEVVGVPRPDRFSPTALLQTLQRILTDQLQHMHTRLASRPLLLHEQALVHQRSDAVQDFDCGIRIADCGFVVWYLESGI